MRRRCFGDVALAAAKAARTRAAQAQAQVSGAQAALIPMTGALAKARQARCLPSRPCKPATAS